MKVPLLSYLVLSIAIFHSLQWRVTVQARGVASKNWADLVPNLLIFGDSIVDTGNNNKLNTLTKANFAPYGKDFIGKKATGRFSNGKVIPDMIASYMGLKEYVPPYIGTNLTAKDLQTGVSFASAGTGFDIVTSTSMNVISMKKELVMFEEYKKKLVAVVGKSKGRSVISKAACLICAGSNDVVQYFGPLSRINVTLAQYSEQLMEMAIQYVKDVYKLGGRRFVVIGLPPVGCVPSQRTIAGGISRACASNRNEFSLTYNKKLKAEMSRLKRTKGLPGSKLVFVDIYPVLMELIQYPDKYGFKESKKGCCGTGLIEVAALCNSKCQTCTNSQEYVFWDSYHPTERAYKILVDSVIEKALQGLM